MDTADRHFQMFRAIREQGPIDPDKQIPGIPRQPAVPLQRQKGLADTIRRGEKAPLPIPPAPRKAPPMGGVRG